MPFRRLVFILFIFFLYPLQTRAGENEKCLQRCSIGLGAFGKNEVFCSCGNGSNFERYWNTSQKTEKTKQLVFLRNKLRGFSQESFRSVQNGDCQARLKNNSYETHDLDEAHALLSVATLPICECVENRLRFPLRKFCGQSRAGEKYCRFELKNEKPPAQAPVRALSLQDFQACEAQKNSYRKPASCRDAACKVSLPTCSAGYEPSNVADPGSCCPKFLCKKIEVIL